MEIETGVPKSFLRINLSRESQKNTSFHLEIVYYCRLTYFGIKYFCVRETVSFTPWWR